MGIKRKIHPSLIKLEQRDGVLQVVGGNSWYSYFRDPYHLMLTIPWLGFVAIVVGFDIFLNAVFAVLYLLDADAIAGIEKVGFLEAFFFSVQTLASIGYGVMNPHTLYANLIVTLESIASLMLFAVITGIAFTRFAKSSSRVMFSRVATIHDYNGIPTLMFRTANERRNNILEAKLSVFLMIDEITVEGHRMRRLHELKLVRDHSPVFLLSWTVMHIIDESSPLYRITNETMERLHAQILVSLTGVDETIEGTIHARHMYASHNLLYDRRFIDVIHMAKDGHRYLDYTYFHETTAI
ncbi:MULTISPECIES: ion channel [Pseudanabaena]|uniref:K channel inward rectifier conserved region 2 domain protein n=2 Tax=Pseudanabaena TaxID=1152 RepID=L8MS50_9CYAN|nr:MULTISPECIES: ion channel [Pseudanabaena]ELS30727.1 K channel inward rectifier conserved region 2 domain protein [Pseudanabaena biceps PCC 7429]MDG3497000.1 ion channel [Pseudanabaena catenata USMAC16]